MQLKCVLDLLLLLFFRLENVLDPVSGISFTCFSCDAPLNTEENRTFYLCDWNYHTHTHFERARARMFIAFVRCGLFEFFFSFTLNCRFFSKIVVQSLSRCKHAYVGRWRKHWMNENETKRSKTKQKQNHTNTYAHTKHQ